MYSSSALATVAVLGLIRSTQAWYNDLPPCLSPFDPFVYTGCYDNGQPGEPTALSLRTDLDTQNMTVEICVAECKGNNFRLAGLSYFGVCYCGETVATALLDNGQCSFPCTGNSSETCGGNTQVSVWMDPTFPQIANQSISEYVPVGCWTDDSPDGKALFYRQEDLNSSTMTTEACLASCLAGEFPFAGTEYAGECYCGVVVGNGTSLVSDSTSCNMPCNGNSLEICGGPARLSLYVAKDLQSLEPCGAPPDGSSSSSSIGSSTSSTSASTLTSSSTSMITSSSTSTPTSTSTSAPTSSSTSTPTSTFTPTTTSVTTSKTSTSATFSTTRTTTGPLCTSTVVKPPTCEFKCGKWCSNPILDFDDNQSCNKARTSCSLQVADCFLTAGFPDAMDCFNFGEWCDRIKGYCDDKCSNGKCGGKPDCFKSLPPKGGDSTTTTASTTTCASTPTTTVTPTTTTTMPVPPAPTGICTQPWSSKGQGYGPGRPVGGIELPLVTCNNVDADWQRGNIFKLYTHSNSRDCRAYPRSQVPDACADACAVQFHQCESVYQQGCKTGGHVNGKDYGQGYSPNNGNNNNRRAPTYFEAVEVTGRTNGRFRQNERDADAACKAQYDDCRRVNRNPKVNGKCGTFGSGW
ncbi:WSC domain-containing protein [Xylariaceae sp. FL0016]|nr:WSC domain-containing protein [Xylariaceae sp. FL0016]